MQINGVIKALIPQKLKIFKKYFVKYFQNLTRFSADSVISRVKIYELLAAVKD